MSAEPLEADVEEGLESAAVDEVVAEEVTDEAEDTVEKPSPFTPAADEEKDIRSEQEPVAEEPATHLADFAAPGEMTPEWQKPVEEFSPPEATEREELEAGEPTGQEESASEFLSRLSRHEADAGLAPAEPVEEPEELAPAEPKEPQQEPQPAATDEWPQVADAPGFEEEATPAAESEFTTFDLSEPQADLETVSEKTPEPAGEPVLETAEEELIAEPETAEPEPEIEVDEELARYQKEARRFARLLVSEIKLYNEDKVERGRESKSLYQMLQQDIARSREMYEKRAHESVRKSDDFFHDELIRILAKGESELLGDDYPGPHYG